MSVRDALAAAPPRTMPEAILVWLQRIAAAYCLLSGMVYWARLVGLHPGSAWRFDLMPLHWQVAGVTLAVFFPFAAIGLWMLASWGSVIWVICAGSEVAMFGLFPGLFGRNDLAIATHLLTAAIYVAVRLLIFNRKRKASVSVR